MVSKKVMTTPVISVFIDKKIRGLKLFGFEQYVHEVDEYEHR